MITSNIIYEYEPHRFSVDATALGWGPGQWPHALPTNMGNCRPLLFERMEVRDDDLLWVDYLQDDGCMRLRIYND